MNIVHVMTRSLAFAVLILILAGPALAKEKDSVAVFPLVPAAGQEYDGIGPAVQNLIENVVVLNPELYELYFCNVVNWLFPDAAAYDTYVRGHDLVYDRQNSPQPLYSPSRFFEEQSRVRYYILGTVAKTAKGYTAKLVLRDLDTPELRHAAIDLDIENGLREFRKELLAWLEKYGLGLPSQQARKAMWTERQTTKGMRLFGEAYKMQVAYAIDGSYKDKIQKVAHGEHPKRNWTTDDEKKDLDLTSYQKAVAVSPRSYLAANNLGWGLQKKGNSQEARQAFEKALSLNPDGIDALDGVIKAALRLKDKDTVQNFAKRKAACRLVDVAKMEARMLCKFAVNRTDDRAYAMQILQTAQTLDPSKAKYPYARAYFMGENGDNREECLDIINECRKGIFDERERALLDFTEAGFLRALIDDKIKSGDYDTATKYLPDLLELFYAIYENPLLAYQKDGADLSGLLEQLPDLSSIFKGYLDTATVVQRVLDKQVALYGTDSKPAVATRVKLADIHVHLGNYARGKALYEEVLKRRDNIDKASEPYIKPSLGYADALIGLGEYAAAKTSLETLITALEHAEGFWDAKIQTRLRLAAVFAELGEHAQARDILEKAYDIQVLADHDNTKLHADLLDKLATEHAVLKDYGTALALYASSLQCRRRAYGPDHPETARTLANMANTLALIGRNDEAAPLFAQVMAIREKWFGPNHPAVAECLRDAGIMAMRRQDGNAAREDLYRALFISRQFDDPKLTSTVCTALQRLFAGEDKTAQAIFFGKTAVNAIQRLRTKITTLDKRLQHAFLTDKADTYRDLADLLAGSGRIAEAQQVLAMLKEEEYFDFLRRDATDDARSTLSSYTGVERELAARFDAISDNIVALGKEQEALLKQQRFGLTPEEQARLEVLNKNMGDARSVFTTFLDKLDAEFAKDAPDRSAELASKHLGTLESLQNLLQQLGPGSVLVHTVMAKDRLWLIVTTSNAQVARESPVGAKALSMKITAYRQLLEDPRTDPVPAAKELYDCVMGPIEADLRQYGAKTVMFSLDGSLRYLPLAALHDSTGWLVERYAVAIFTEAAKTNLALPGTPDWSVAGLGVTKRHGDFPALPAVAHEISGIVRTRDATSAGILPGITRLDEAFTAKAFSDVLAMGFPVVHLASHFRFDCGTVGNSFLLLGDGTALTLAELQRGDFKFKAVDQLTLSACNTAMGGVNEDGKEIEGFGALAQERGAKAVLATLWPVADNGTGDFMQHLYLVHERDHLSKAESLRQTQLACIRGELRPGGQGEEGARGSLPLAQGDPQPPTDYRHPFYWAPFILMGNWR